MSEIDPSKTPSRDPDLDRQFEYLKGMAQAPMGWPEALPPSRTIDPADLERELDNKVSEPLQNPEQFRRSLVVAVLLTMAVIGIIIWII
jgi:hypothetical protein